MLVFLFHIAVADFTGNDFTGSMPEGICDLFVDHKLTQLTADCPEVECLCCTNTACAI
jgi:hypothetical protein